MEMRWDDVEVYVGTRKWGPKPEQRDSMYQELEAPLMERESESLKKAVERTSGRLETGEMCCLMGPSGAGKTTLLAVLGSRPQLGKDGYWTGRVLVNGRPPTGRWRRQIAFVMQRDIFFEELTVRQELEFALILRTSSLKTKEARTQRFNDVVRALGLERVLESKIGSSVERGLSGGEVKRLNIAVELFITDANICLLDEPLTGLDSTRAYSVLSALRIRAHSAGVLLSVHQPSSKIWALFDRLLLLAPKGRVVYDGKASHAADYFNSIGKPVPNEWNPPDHFIEVISITEDDDQGGGPSLLRVGKSKSNMAIDDMVRAWRENQHQKNEDVESTVGGESIVTSVTVPTPTPPTKPPSFAPFGLQVRALTNRAFANAKGTDLKPTRWLLVMSLAGIWGLLWFSIARSKKKRGNHAADVVSIVYFFVAQWAWGPSFQQVTAFPAERDVLTKELASEVYSIEAYFIAKQIAELPVSTILPAGFYLILFPLVGLPMEALPATYLISLLHSWVSTSLGVALSALIFDGELTATVIIIVNIYQSCCGGFFIDMSRQPAWVSWVKYSSYWYYATGLYLKVVALPYDNGNKDLHTEISDYSFSRFNVGIDIAILFLYGVILRLIAYLALKYSPKIRFA